jgi:hypothetical protein
MLDALESFFEKILSLLRIRPAVAGLEISDQVLRLAYRQKKAWHMEALRLAPGIMEKGKVLDAPALTAALRELKSRVTGALGKKKINVMVSLSSANIYSQVFTLPIMEGEEFKKAIELNVQMASPVDVAHAYFGWQLLGRDEVSLRSEIAAAFVDKAIVDDVTVALYAAGFVTVGIESRALALARVLRKKGAGLDAGKSYVLLDIDNTGVDFLIIRNGKLYFEYATPWSDLADDKGQITTERFTEALESDLRQVMNFYTQHWPDPLAAVILSAAAFKEAAESAVASSLSLPVVPLMLDAGFDIAPEWYIALGAGLRRFNASNTNEEINLSGDKVVDVFHQEWLLDFFALSRVLIPAVLGFLLVVLIGTDSFLHTVRSNVESQSVFSLQGSETTALMALEASSTAFNQSVALVANAESQINKNYLLITDINAIAAANGISVSDISFQTSNLSILVTGTASAATQIDGFKSGIQNDPHFGLVTLPLGDIQQNGAGGYSFSMSFSLSTPF